MLNLPFALNSEPVKWVLIIASSPVWLPFLKTLWREWDDSLRDEGGLFGFAPTRVELQRRNEREGKFETPLRSVTWEEHERERNPYAALEERSGKPGKPPAARMRRR